jgi:hypothetical protein
VDYDWRNLKRHLKCSEYVLLIENEMEPSEKNSNGKRICGSCQLSLADDDHGNRKYHMECESKRKKQNQKVKYKIGNSAKLMIQKNEGVAASLYKMDMQKAGIPLIVAMEPGLKFDCPSVKRKYLNKEINMFDQYGYALETINREILIFIFHESDIQ